MKRYLGHTKEYLVLGGLAFIALAAAFAIVKAALDLPSFLTMPLDSITRTIVVDGLDIVVLLELYAILADYRIHERLNPITVLDTSLFFVLREALVDLAQGHLTFGSVLIFAVLLATVVVLRIALTIWGKERAQRK